MQLAETRNTELQETSKQRDEAVAHLSPELAANMLKLATGEYHGGRILEALALLGRAYKAAPADHPTHAIARGLIGGWSAQAGPLMLHDGAVLAAAYSPDGNIAVTGSSDHTARLWDTHTGMPFGTPIQLNLAVGAVCFGADGLTIATGCENGIGQLWSVESRKTIGLPVRHPGQGPIHSVAISSDGWKLLTVGGGDGTARLWRSQTGESIGEPIGGPPYSVSSAVFSPDGRTVFAASGNTVRFCDAASGKPFGKALEHKGIVSCLDCSRDGRYLVTACESGKIQLWEVATHSLKEPVMEYDSDPTHVTFSPDGSTIAVGFQDGTVQFWNTKTGKARGDSLRTSGSTTTVTYSPDGRFILMGSTDHSARIFDTQPGIALRDPGRYLPPINRATFAADGQTVVTASTVRNICLWNVKTGELIGQPMEHRAFGKLTLSPSAPMAKYCSASAVTMGNHPTKQ